MEDRLRYLFRKYLDNTCSRDEMEEFFVFVRRAEHDEALRQVIKNVYKELASTEADAWVDEKGRLIFTDYPQPDTSPVVEKKRKRSGLLITAAVATGLIVMALVFKVSDTNRSKERTHAIASVTRKTTNRSETKFILLEDSTKVWLNNASSLEFPDQFDQKRREVFLSGEAYFDVKHADKIPFIIHTGAISTTVLGTAFNIKAYPKQRTVIVSVSRGKVKITRTDGWETTLIAGQQLTLKEDGPEAKEKTIPTETVAGWQEGNISYDDETLLDIISDMERTYNVNIRIVNPAITQLRISTSFKREIGVEQALQVLCKLTDTELKIKKDAYYIQ